MSDENQNDAPTPDAQENAEERTFTQADINRIIAREKRSLETQLRTQLAEEAKRSEMSELERIRAELAERDSRLAAAEAERAMLKRIASLSSRVVDPEAAARLVEDKHLNEDGTINVDLFLQDRPYFAPARAPQPPRAPLRQVNSPPTVGASMNDLIRRKARG